jgi:hypothetical protein
MPVTLFPDGLEPEPDAIIWRFMEFWKYRDLISTSELYFRRADRLGDDDEGLPPEDYLPYANLDPLDLRDALQLNHFRGSLAQDREAFFVNCWYLFDEEKGAMWKEYGNDGVAIVSRYKLLKHAITSCESSIGSFAGMVRYGSRHLTGWNVLRFISTKREQFAHEREVRAMLWVPYEYAGGNRHFDENNIPHDRPLTHPPAELVPEGLRRKVDLHGLISEVRVSPWASEATFNDAKHVSAEFGYAMPVVWSDLAQFKHLAATEQDLLELLRTRK